MDAALQIEDLFGYRALNYEKLKGDKLGVPYTAFNEVLNGKRPVSADLALLLEASLGVNAGVLVRMQTDYNLQRASQDKTLAKRLEQIRKVACL
ncbi:helix-turn-helix transcriptional regulator [Limibacterium fermenti]|uniref:helix-turn-helix transcriptional regulator n=1 Tax=Limibacterium fermenti TaxID=3229863 RepID=UPI0026AC58C4